MTHDKDTDAEHKSQTSATSQAWDAYAEMQGAANGCKTIWAVLV